jgi:hypothetical protein
MHSYYKPTTSSLQVHYKFTTRKDELDGESTTYILPRRSELRWLVFRRALRCQCVYSRWSLVFPGTAARLHIIRSSQQAALHPDVAPISSVHSDFAASYGDLVRSQVVDQHEWYAFPNMTRDEVLAFRTYDSD